MKLEARLALAVLQCSYAVNSSYPLRVRLKREIMAILDLIENTSRLHAEKQAALNTLRLLPSSDPDFQLIRGDFLIREADLEQSTVNLIEELEDLDPLDREDMFVALDPDLRNSISSVLNLSGHHHLMAAGELTLEPLLIAWRHARLMMLFYQFLQDIPLEDLARADSLDLHPIAERSREHWATAVATLQKEAQMICSPEDRICHLGVTHTLLEQVRARYQRLTVRVQDALKAITADGNDPWPVIRLLPPELAQCAWDALKLVPLREEEVEKIVVLRQVGDRF